jgi:hypothetical protein
MVDLNDPQTISRIYDSVDSSRYKLQAYRNNRRMMIEQYCGDWYGENFIDNMVPVNFIALAAGIYARQLAANYPAVLVSTPHAPYRYATKALEKIFPILFEECNFREEVEAWVYEALFGFGVARVGIEESTSSYAGKPYFRTVSMDDYIIDMTRENLRRGDFHGNVYTMPIDEIRENPNFDEDARKVVQPMDRREYNYEGDERASQIGEGDHYGVDEGLEYYGELMDLYFPRYDIIVTMPRDQQDSIRKPLRVVYNAFPFNPYQYLYFRPVPGNTLPLPPLSILKSLSDLGNSLFIKIGEQANRQKTIGVAQASSVTDARRVIDAADGEVIKSDTGAPMQEYRFGGADPGTVAAFIEVKQLLNFFGGNFEILGGLGVQADTLGQEELLAQNSGSMIADMRERVVKSVQDACRALAHLIWTDPARAWTLTHKLPNTGIEYSTIFTPDDRNMPISSFEIKIDPYSMRPTSPVTRMRAILSLMKEIVFPLMPHLQQQGIAVDVRALVEEIMRLSQIDELNHILKFSPRMAAGPAGGNEGGGNQPAQTLRQYERIGRPGASQQGQDGIMSRMLTSMMQRPGAQPAETASIGR